MKKFLTNILVFIIPTFLFIVLLEIFLRFIPNEFSFKKQFLDKNSNDIETLILGDSETYFGLNPSFFSSRCFNAANTQRPILYDFRVYDKYKNDFENLKNIIVSVSFESLNYNPFKKHEPTPWGVFNYTIYYKLTNESSFKNNFEILSLPLPNIRKKIDLFAKRKLHNDSDYGWTDLGWGDYYNSSLGYTINMEEDGLKAKKEYDSIAFDYNSKKLYHFIEELNTRNINVIIITPPVYKTYRENLNPKCVQKTYDILKDITLKYDNCFYYNFSSDTAFHKDDFWDSNHVNEKGAKKFSLLVNNILQN